LSTDTNVSEETAASILMVEISAKNKKYLMKLEREDGFEELIGCPVTILTVSTVTLFIGEKMMKDTVLKQTYA
jgi:hypothetical protein